MKNTHINAVIFTIIALALWFRATYYGDLRLSIGTHDTGTYVDAAKAPLLSWDTFSGRRLLTTNLIYKLGNDAERCKLPFISTPASGDEGHREIQPCYDAVAYLQNILSLTAWCLLAWMVARWLTNPLLKIMAVCVILAYGFTPQLAEWDSILGSESLSVSLLAIVFAMLMEIAFRLAGREGFQLNSMNRFLIPLWIAVFMMWVFVRDVHLYSIPLTLILILPFILFGNIRSETRLLPMAVILLSFFLLGNYGARQSNRWQLSVIDTLDGHVFPYPSRIEYFKSMGMPEDMSSPEFGTWLDEKGLGAYRKFLLDHPGFILTNVINHANYFRSDFFQPYYRFADTKYRDVLVAVGEMVHPETNAIYLIDGLLLVSLCIAAWRQQGRMAIAKAWLALWLFGYAAISLFVTFFGDTNGVHRHIYPSVESFRLFFWVFLFQVLDMHVHADGQTGEYRGTSS